MSTYRKGRSQQVTRIPPYRPGDWVWVSADKVQRRRLLGVRSITCAITASNMTGPAQWTAHFTDGSSVPIRLVERLARDDERPA